MTGFKEFSQALKGVFIVPGMPQLLKPELNANYKTFANALDRVSEKLIKLGVKRIVYFSTQWLSVLAHLLQAKKQLKGSHVDENWYDLGDLAFDFRIDDRFAQSIMRVLKEQKYPVAMVDYQGFPVDTASIVADRLLNPKADLLTNMVSCHVYSDFAATEKLGVMVRSAIEKDKTPTAVVAVSLMSARYFTTDIDYREDHLSKDEDDDWNKRILNLLEDGKHNEVGSLLSDYCLQAKVDMGFKAYAFAKGVIGSNELRPASCFAYGPIYGAGAAIISF